MVSWFRRRLVTTCSRLRLVVVCRVARFVGLRGFRLSCRLRLLKRWRLRRVLLVVRTRLRLMLPLMFRSWEISLPIICSSSWRLRRSVVWRRPARTALRSFVVCLTLYRKKYDRMMCCRTRRLVGSLRTRVPPWVTRMLRYWRRLANVVLRRPLLSRRLKLRPLTVLRLV